MKYLRRALWYVCSRLFWILLILSILVTTFYYAMNLTNIYVVLKDGMARRAQCVMLTEDTNELNKYFQQSFLERDQAIQLTLSGNSPYKDYNIRGIDHRLGMSFVWVWPWDDAVRVDISEEIPRIDGRVKGTRAEELIARDGESAIYPPKWQSARYRVSLGKENGRWLIKSLALIENLNTGE